MLILAGAHIAVAPAACSAIGVFVMLGSDAAAESIPSNTAHEAARKDVFAVIPPFVPMGDTIRRSGAAGGLHRICDRALRRLRGRLAIATVAGVSIAAPAAVSRIAHPQREEPGHRQSLALGAVAGSACLGMLVPPSVLLIVWAILTEPGAGAPFIAGIRPGPMPVGLLAAHVIVAAVARPSSPPRGRRCARSCSGGSGSWRSSLSSSAASGRAPSHPPGPRASARSPRSSWAWRRGCAAATCPTPRSGRGAPRRPS